MSLIKKKYGEVMVVLGGGGVRLATRHISYDGYHTWRTMSFIAALCPSGYTNFPPYHCYKITPTAQPWDASLRLCQDEGSSLAALETPGEFKALRPWIQEQGD